MKGLSAAALVSLLALGASACEDFLDVNTNPNAPQAVTPNLYLPPMIHWLATSEQFDGRFIARYSQVWVLPHTSGATPNNWVRHGYDPGNDNGAQLWRDVYWNLGVNLSDMLTRAEAEERWDVVGVGQLLRAWGWLSLTAMHGEIIIKEAFTPDQYYFNYDTQEYAYQEVLRLLDLAITNLQRTDGRVNAGYLAVGDKLFIGDRGKWMKLAHGLKARALNHFSNKAS